MCDKNDLKAASLAIGAWFLNITALLRPSHWNLSSDAYIYVMKECFYVLYVFKKFYAGGIIKTRSSV